MIRGTIQYVRSPEVTAKLFTAGVRQANVEVIESWEHDDEPQHFTIAGAKKYGYQARSGEGEPQLVPSRAKNPALAGRMVYNRKYFWMKIKRGFGRTPDVRTGASREAAKTISITSSVNRGVGKFPLLQPYFFKYNKSNNSPDKAAELVTVTDDEIKALAKVHEKSVAKFLEAQKPRSSVSFG